MPIRSFRAQDFRCLQSIEFEAAPNYNLVYGANASGKTSLLEALSYLGRGKSFRGAPTGSLVRHGQAEFVLVGKVLAAGRESTVGVRNGREGLEVRIDGDGQVGVAELAEALPLQVIDPAVHELVSGGPDGRRRFLDWAAFHVEHGFLAAWRRYRRALKQRNASLKQGDGLEAWTQELVQAGERLDGLPLAIELAAARTAHLPPRALLPRIEGRLTSLGGLARDVPARLRTMRDAIDWSYHLLDEPEQRLFARLSVFVGGFSIEAAQAVGFDRDDHDDDWVAIDRVASLVDQSLLGQQEGPEGEPRFTMLETIREYGLHHLAQDGDLDDTRRRHADWCLTFAQSIRSSFAFRDDAGWRDQLEAELGNLRAALQWHAAHGRVGPLLELATALFPLWYHLGRGREGARWLPDGLGRADGAPPEIVLRASRVAAELIAESSEAGLARILQRYGDERFARRIARAAKAAYELGPRDDAFAAGEAATLEKLAALQDGETIEVGDAGRRFFAPATLDDLAALYAQHPEATLSAGSTDVGLWVTKQMQRPETVIYSGRVAELAQIEETAEGLEIGAGVTYSDAMSLLARHYPDQAGLHDAWTAEVLAVLEDPAFSAVFATGSRAEVPVMGAISGTIISGQIDRLAISGSRVLIVDYKTNRPPPSRVEDVHPAYLAQLAAYRRLLQEIYPDHEVDCALLWTWEARLMPVSAELMDHALLHHLKAVTGAEKP